MKRGCLLLICLLLVGCQSLDTPIVWRTVTAYAVNNPQGQVFLIVPDPDEKNRLPLDPRDPVFIAYAAPVEAALIAQGYRKATPELPATIIITVFFKAGAETISKQSLQPIYSVSGGTTETHSFYVPTSSGMKTVTGTSTTPAQLKVAGYAPYEISKNFTLGVLELTAYPWPVREPLQRLWVTRATITGEQLPLGEPLNALLARQIAKHIGTNNGQIDNVDAAGNPLSK